MTPHYEDATVTLLHGDCLDVMRELPDASVDAICTDPPYGLGFMGREWDALPPGLPWALECLRVLKPGGHLLAFGGTRTWHRLACAVEDAGFEVRDSIAWLYGSGFPKSLDVSKAIDKARHDRPDVLAVAEWLREQIAVSGIPRKDIGAHFGLDPRGVDLWAPNPNDNSAKQRVRTPTWDQWCALSDLLALPDVMDAEVWRLNGRKGSPGEAWDQREKIGEKTSAIATPGDVDRYTVGGSRSVLVDITAPATPDAERWQGWGTALKPAFEPVVVARKPLVGAVAANVLAHGTGALNIDGCRVDGVGAEAGRTRHGGGIVGNGSSYELPDSRGEQPAGRWPANVVLDESQAAALDAQSGGSVSKSGGHRGENNMGNGVTLEGGKGIPFYERGGHDDQGGASRFFYTAKAASDERVRVAGVAHPTVKPLALMRWLVRLVTPPGGTVLEPFAGSGTTVEACILEGFNVVAIEREADYLPLIVQRINRRRDPVQAVKAAGEDGGLFDLLHGPAA